MAVSIAELMNESGVRFGTSGARGLVSAMTDRVCYAYARGFLQMLLQRRDMRDPLRVAIAGDLRSSTPRIMNAAARAAMDLGFDVVNGGYVPSPAIALYGLDQGIASLMITGSHIPDDRNGMKFNKPTGEMLKADEAEMLEQSLEVPDYFDHAGRFFPGQGFDLPTINPAVASRYLRRWKDAFASNALDGKKIVVFGHSAVGRDILVEVYESLGAGVIKANWSDKFVPVDTEAIRPEDVATALELTKLHAPFAIVSTDGDSDRPLLSDEYGQWLRGDVVGVLVARWLSADAVVTPVSCNTVVERVAQFQTVRRTKIGSPYVIAGMQEAVAEGYRRVVGYEANGGFLSATDISLPSGASLTALPTRDPIIAQLAVLMAAIDSKRTVSQLLAGLPARFTSSDRLESFPSSLSRSHLSTLAAAGSSSIDQLLGDLIGQVEQIDTTDGLRISGKFGDIVHLRASGNAPELRCYAEAATPERAQLLTKQTLVRCASWRD